MSSYQLTDGATGQQRSFIDECWTYATPTPPGQQGATGQQSDGGDLLPSDPVLPQSGWGSISPDDVDGYVELPRDTTELDPPRSEYWAKRAAGLLSQASNPELRADLRYLFEEREAIACLDGKLSAHEAGELAFGELQTVMHQAGIICQ